MISFICTNCTHCRFSLMTDVDVRPKYTGDVFGQERYFILCKNFCQCGFQNSDDILLESIYLSSEADLAN